MLNSRDTKQSLLLNIFTNFLGEAIITLPRGFTSILAGVPVPGICACPSDSMQVHNGWYSSSGNGVNVKCTTDSFIEQNGRFCVFQDWAGSMLLRFSFEHAESAGEIHIRGKFAGDDVYSLFSSSWISGEKLSFVGTATVTSTKLFDSVGLSIIKPVTTGRVSMFAVDEDNVETLVAIYDPSETVPRWRRYKVPNITGVDLSILAGVTTTDSGGTSLPASQFYSRDEIDSMFADSGTITVNSTGTHDLAYSAYFLRTVKIIAQAGTYTHNFTLDNSTVKTGAIFRARLELAASAGNVIRFYDNSTGSTLLQESLPDAGLDQYLTWVFEWDSANWHFVGREL